jgi:hypothetical protein
VPQSSSIATCKTENRRTLQVTEAAATQNRNYRAEGTWGRQHREQQRRSSSRNTQHLIDHSALLFAAPIRSIGSNHHKKSRKDLQERIRITTAIKSQGTQCRIET